MMAPEEDPDQALLVDWRAGSLYAEKLMMVKNESCSWKASASAGTGDRMTVPVVFDLSDSDGTPLRSRAPAGRPAERRAPVAKLAASTSWKQNANSEVLVIDSDSDEDFTPKATFKLSVNLEKLSQPSTQEASQGKVDSQIVELSGKVDRLRESVSQGGLLERAISLDEAGTESLELSGMVGKPGESVSEGFILGTELSLDRKTMVDLTSCGTDVQMALKAVTAYVADLPTRFEDDSQKAGPSTTLGSLVTKANGRKEGNVGTCSDYLETSYGSDKLLECAAEVPKALAPDVEAMSNFLLPVCASEEDNRMSTPVQVAIHELSSDDDGCNPEPEWLRRDHKPISGRGGWNSGGSSPHNWEDWERPEHFQPDLGGNGGVSNHSAGKKRPLRNLPGFESHEKGREPKRSSLDQPAILDLSSDDDGCPAEPSWLRDFEPVPLRGSLYSGVSSAHECKGQGTHEQCLSTSVVNSELGDHTASWGRLSVHIPGLESPENYGTPISPSVNDLESDEDAPKRKRGRARKVTLSEDELASREAQKQRARELKKARQEEEKRAREEKREELKRQKEASKVDAAEKKRIEKECDKWRKGKFALQNTIVHLDHAVVEMKSLGPLLIGVLGAKDYTYRLGANPIKQTILWTMKQPSADSQVETDGLGSQADIMNSQLSNSQLALEDVEMEYVVVVYQGEEFARLVAEKLHEANLATIRKQYPTYSICYLISGLKGYLKKKEQRQFRSGDQNWTRPNVEQVLAEFITHHEGVNFRLCIDESEISDHVAGLTRSLAARLFKKKLTSISVQANGDHVRKNDINSHIIRKSTWLKFLVAIEGVSSAVAIAVEKEYPTMRALLNAYLDPGNSVREKEVLLEHLEKASGGRKKVGPVLSKRIYRVLTATDGNLSTKDVEDGADYFENDD